MSVYRRHNTENDPSFVTTNTAERRAIFRSRDVCQQLIDTIYATRRKTNFQLLAFVLMPDHLHLILVSPALARVMQLIKGRFAHDYNKAHGLSGALWQNRFHERTLRSEAGLSSALEYVDLNPVNAGFVEKPEDYPWSTAGGRYATDLDEYLSG